jgi:hypothetical protein
LSIRDVQEPRKKEPVTGTRDGLSARDDIGKALVFLKKRADYVRQRSMLPSDYINPLNLSSPL